MARLAEEVRTAPVMADRIDQAIKVIEANGYCRNYLWDTTQAGRGTPLEYCRVDILGALATAIYGQPTCAGEPEVRAIEQVLTERITAPSVAAWACYPGNGERQALALLRGTANELRATATTA